MTESHAETPGVFQNAEALDILQLPGAAVFPESVGVDTTTGDAYVGSLADGTIYRLTSAGEVEVFSEAGADGRTSVAGVKVDGQHRLWVAGGYDGTLFVYDLADRSLLAHRDIGARPSCVNDIAFGPAGEGYVTDSLVPVLFVVDAESLVLEPWIDLAEQGVPWPEGLNFNGIVLTADAEHLVACQTNLGRFWRMTLSTGQVDEVRLEGGPLEHCDGLAAIGSQLYVAVNARNEIVEVELAGDGSSGRVQRVIRSDAFAFPTAVAVLAERLLVVNGQLDRMGGEPALPFTVVSITR